MRFILVGLLLLPMVLKAQDERHIAQPNDGGFSQLAYRISVRGKLMLDTSYMGLDIYNQEPLLGQNLGLMKSTISAKNSGAFNSLFAEYMQNGSLGRRIDVEVRVYNDGVAFRYLIPKSTPVDEILIHDEGTGFAFVHADALARTEPNTRFDLPFVTAQPEAGWVAITEAAITEAGESKYPRMYLVHADGPDLITRLAPTPHNPNVVFEGTTPLEWPWRLVVFGFDREHLAQAEVFRDLHR
jgi:alpha-glucosidase